MTSTAIPWYRRDLRVHDHPALRAAARPLPLRAAGGVHARLPARRPERRRALEIYGAVPAANA